MIADLPRTLDVQVEAALEYIKISPGQFRSNPGIVHFNVAPKAPYGGNVIHVPRVQLIFAGDGSTEPGKGVKYDYMPSRFGIASVDAMVTQVIEHYRNRGLTLDETLYPNR